jgi:hypothetical protein
LSKFLIGGIIIKGLLLSIFFSSILGLILLFLGIPGAVIAFGIIAGSLFMGLYLLVDLQEKLTKVTDHLTLKEQEVKEVIKVSDEEEK